MGEGRGEALRSAQGDKPEARLQRSIPDFRARRQRLMLSAWAAGGGAWAQKGGPAG